MASEANGQIAGTIAQFPGMVGGIKAGIAGVRSGIAAVRGAVNTFDDAGRCANIMTKLVQGGCFVAGTRVTVAELPYSPALQAEVWSEPDWLDNRLEAVGCRLEA